MNKRVLITGGSGFVGANLARQVLRDGHEVHLLLRRGYQAWRIDEIGSDVRMHEASIEDGEAVSAAVRRIRPDWVFHLAAYGAYPGQQGMERMVNTNLLGCVSLLDACAANGVGVFVNAGSSSEYGIKDHAPDEEEPLVPDSPYAITKAAATHYCRMVSRAGGPNAVNAVTVRLYSVYGPYEDPGRLIPTLIVCGLNGRFPPLVSPETARDFIFVDDAVDAMIRVASADVPRGSVYNVCSGVQVNLGEAVDQVRQLMAVPEEPVWGSMAARGWDTNIWVGTGARIEREVGWRPSTSFASGLAQTMDWFMRHPRWLRFYAGASHG